MSCILFRGINIEVELPLLPTRCQKRRRKLKIEGNNSSYAKEQQIIKACPIQIPKHYCVSTLSNSTVPTRNVRSHVFFNASLSLKFFLCCYVYPELKVCNQLKFYNQCYCRRSGQNVFNLPHLNINFLLGSVKPN